MPTSHSHDAVMAVQLLYLVWRKLNYNKHGVPVITHKAYLPTVQTSSPTNLVQLMLYFGNTSLIIQKCNTTYGKVTG
jgi:hypothetical protein